MAKPVTLNIAHRGARSLAPENTLAAAKKALEIGADMWELDVGVSADGQLIVMHDDSLSRTTNVEAVFPNRAPWHFTTFTLAEIKQLETTSVFIREDPFEQIAAGVVTADDLAAFQAEPVPTLREALLFTRNHNWRVNVEIKRSPPPMEKFPVAQAVVSLIEALDMFEQVVVSSFIPRYLNQVKTLNPAVDIAVLSRGVLPMSILIHWFGVNPDVDICPWQYFSGNNPASFLNLLNSRTYHPYYAMHSPEQIKALQDDGFTVNFWTVNDPTHMKRLIQMGVNGIMTDYPHWLQPLLSDR